MSRKAKARISWLQENEGGRPRPPIGPRYVTVVRFLDDETDFDGEAWSLVVELPETPDPPRQMIADVSFLVDDAPHHLIHSGSKFDLYEGSRIVATGEVL